MEKRSCSCGQKAAVYLPTGDYCTRCITDKVNNAKQKTYQHLCSIGLGRNKTETKEEWIKRMRDEFWSRSKKLKLEK